MRSFVVLVVLGWCMSACAVDHDSPLMAAGAGGDVQPDEPVDAGEQPRPHELPPADDDPVKPTQSRDAGVMVAPTDAGMDASQHGAGKPVLDAGTPVIDAGLSMHDAGSPSIDAGQPAIDAGTPAIDSGTPAIDAGQPAIDSGTPDAGQPAIDSGTPDSGTPIDAGTPAQDAAVDSGPAAPSCSGPPGLYKDDKCQLLSDGIQAYHPQYPLWSDGANKERFIYLPAGTRIDTSNADRWSFPKGTRFYKTFASGTLKVETRVMEKTGTTTGFDSWTLTSYAWSADQHSVSAASANGVTNALGTSFDIPSQAQCRSCHNMSGADAPIGFNAIQLNHQDGGVMLSDLLNQNLLVNGTSASLNISLTNTRIPGDAAARAALGYLHGNCGHCHGGPNPRAGQRLWSVVGMTQLADAPIMQSAVCHCLEGWTGRKNASGDAYVLRVAPSHAAISGIIGRMGQRGAGEQMPPLGTKFVDANGLAAVKAWITALDGTSCDNVPPICVP